MVRMLACWETSQSLSCADWRRPLQHPYVLLDVQTASLLCLTAECGGVLGITAAATTCVSRGTYCAPQCNMSRHTSDQPRHIPG
jgi:hypothetical protein